MKQNTPIEQAGQSACLSVYYNLKALSKYDPQKFAEIAADLLRTQQNDRKEPTGRLGMPKGGINTIKEAYRLFTEKKLFDKDKFPYDFFENLHIGKNPIIGKIRLNRPTSKFTYILTSLAKQGVYRELGINERLKNCFSHMDGKPLKSMTQAFHKKRKNKKGNEVEDEIISEIAAVAEKGDMGDGKIA